MTVVLVSPFVDPQSVGEPRWCYDLAKAICEREEVVLVSQTPRGRDFRVGDLFPGTRVLEYEPWALDFMPARIDAMAKPNFYRFYRDARRGLRELCANTRIRCAHHFGPLGLRFPTPLRSIGIPYVFGPLGGSLPPPPGFASALVRGAQPWYVRLRGLDRWRWQWDPMLRSSYESAACIVGVAPYVARLLGDLRIRRFETQSEVCARPPVQAANAPARRAGREGPTRLLCVSRLVPSKGVQFAIGALARLDRSTAWTLDVVGAGPMLDELRALTKQRGLGDRITFHGHLPRLEVERFYEASDVFLFPSIQEPSGSVIFEAMGWGLPMVVAAYGGPEQHVDDTFGVRIAPKEPDGFEVELAMAVASLIADPARRTAMGQAAVRAASLHSLGAAADFYVALYRSIEDGQARAA